MRRKSLLFTAALVAFLLIGTGTTLALLVRHEPAFYHQTSVPPGLHRMQQSKRCMHDFVQLIDNIILNDQPEWSGSFTADQINSYLEEDFIRSGTRERVLPDDLHSPRVAIERNRMRLAFRYGNGTWSSVVSVDVNLWLPETSDVIALEVLGIHAGRLPISSQALLDYLTESARQLNMEVTWYRHRGNPVALLRLQADQARPTVHFQQLELQDGKLVIAGKCDRPTALPATPTAVVAFHQPR